MERCYNCGSDKHLALQCPYIKTGPAPKEDGMDNPKRVNCKTCGTTAFEEDGELWCPNCSSKEEDRKVERRAVYREAYMAVLSGICANELIPRTADKIAINAHRVALATVRRWDAMMEELEKEIG